VFFIKYKVKTFKNLYSSTMDYFNECSRNEMISMDTAVINAFFNIRQKTSTCVIEINSIKYLLTEIKNLEIEVENAEGFFKYLNEISSIRKASITFTYKGVDGSYELKKTLRQCQQFPFIDLEQLKENSKLDLSTFKFLNDLENCRAFVSSSEQVCEADLSQNKLRNLTIVPRFFNEKHLRVLNLSGNKLNKMKRKCFRHLTSLQILCLSNCSLKRIKAKQFVNLTNLLYLDLSVNRIKQIEQEAFFDLPILKTLDLSFNKLDSSLFKIFMFQRELELLDLSHNRIDLAASLYVFSGLNALRELDLSFNKFTAEEFHRKRAIFNLNEFVSIKV
jgi:Leucine-rich repeat (LRR) protein